MKKLLCITLAIIIMLSSVNIIASAKTIDPENHPGIVSLDGKKIVIIGNSMVFYGNCVIQGNIGQKDEGYLHQLISANGENADVYDFTYSGKKLEYIYDNYISLMDPAFFSDVDYLVLSEGNQVNEDLLSTVNKYLALFPKDVEFRFLRNPIMLESHLPNLIEGVNDIKNAGYTVVDWGHLIYDIYTGATQVPGATLPFNRNTFIKNNIGFKNGDGVVYGVGNPGDNNHQNPLSGYITAQMLYSSLTNRSAILNDYNFCYDTGIHPYFNIDNFAKVHYTGPEKTNFTEVFRSPKDMLGLQILIDEYLTKEGVHPLTIYKDDDSCVTGELNAFTYCPKCNISTDTKEYIDPTNLKEHTLEFTNSIAPTCTKNGMTASVNCTTCGKSFMTATPIESTGHNIKEKLTKATLSASGSNKEICLYCDKIFKNTYISRIKSVTLTNTAYVFDATQRKPSVKVVDTNNKKLTLDIDYSVTYPENPVEVGFYTAAVKFKGNYAGTKKLTYKVMPGMVNGFNAKTVSNSSLELSFKPVDKATHYRIYQYNSKTKEYEFLVTTQDTTVLLENLSSARKYKFSIRAFTKLEDKNCYSDFYSYVTALTKPDMPTVKKATSTKKGIAKLTFKGVSRAEGYRITYSTDKTFKKSKSVYVKKADISYATLKKLASGKKYYFKIRAFRRLVNEKVFSAYSDVLSVKVK